MRIRRSVDIYGADYASIYQGHFGDRIETGAKILCASSGGKFDYGVRTPMAAGDHDTRNAESRNGGRLGHYRVCRCVLYLRAIQYEGVRRDGFGGPTINGPVWLREMGNKVR